MSSGAEAEAPRRDNDEQPVRRAVLRAEVDNPRHVPFLRIIRLFRPYSARVVLLLLIVLVSAASSLASPFLIRAILDQALPERNSVLLTILALAMLAVALGGSAMSVATSWLSNRIGQQVMHDLRVAVYTHLQRMSFGFFTRTRTGDVQSRITNDIGGVDAILTSTAANGIQGVVRIVAIAISAVVLDWKLAIFALVVLPVYLGFTFGLGRKRRTVVQSRQQRMANMTSLVQESMSVAGVLLAKTMGRQDELRRRFSEESRAIADNEVEAAMLGRWRLASRRASLTIIPAVVYWIAGMTATHGMSAVSIGTIVASVSLLNRMVSPASSLQGIGLNLSTSIAVFARIFDVLDLPLDTPERPGSTHLTIHQGTITLHNLSFRYDPDDTTTPWALHNINLTLPAGTTTAIVGHTGSGKTTLAYLIARLYQPTTGHIELDHTDLRDITAASLANAVGFVSQETYLFHASIADNLRFAAPTATDTDIHTAARAARIHHHIATLPQGYDTIVGERGYRFSGGERQRIAITRLLLRNPPIVILDEATSALDNHTEHAVQEALDELSRGRTTIAIAHRLSTIRNADHIIVLDHGEIIEQGTRQELLAQGGHFATLANQTHIN
jgi:ATP-binding cassette subfamily B protein